MIESYTLRSLYGERRYAYNSANGMKQDKNQPQEMCTEIYLTVRKVLGIVLAVPFSILFATLVTTSDQPTKSKGIRTKVEKFSNCAYGRFGSQIHSAQEGDEERREELNVNIHPYLQFSTNESRCAANELLGGVELSRSWARSVLRVRIGRDMLRHHPFVSRTHTGPRRRDCEMTNLCVESVPINPPAFLDRALESVRTLSLFLPASTAPLNRSQTSTNIRFNSCLQSMSILEWRYQGG